MARMSEKRDDDDERTPLHVPYPRSVRHNASSLAGLLTFFGLSDLTAASLDALPALEYWLANVPVRLTVLFGVTAYSWLFSEGGYLGPTLGAGRHLCNSWVFTFAFMELMIWYWVSSIANWTKSEHC
jgi:hypothetical protein